MTSALSNNAYSVSFSEVSITSDFWKNRMQSVRDGTLPAIYQQMKETGRWDCLKLSWKPGDPKKPHQFWDSDVAKWLEAACYALTIQPDQSLSRLVEEAVDNIRGAQQEDGYINTYYTVVEPEKRWTAIAWSHELYCAGHLLEAALAHQTYTGSNRLLGPLLEYIRYIDSVFGFEEGKKKGYPRHEELELSLVKAFERTGNKNLLGLARYFIEERGRHRPEGHYYDIEAKARGEIPRPGPGYGPPYAYHQADRPLRDMKSIEGHSVRAMYWLTGATGVARLTKDESLLKAIQCLWESTTYRKMYVTGGLGAIPEWEGFGHDYYLPNETGYLETCAAIALVFFAHQMSLTNPYNTEFVSALELALYNAVLVGVALDGKSFFYDNPLATVGKHVARRSWFDVSCCPANVARLLCSVGDYIYSVGLSDTIFIRLYISSTVQLKLPSGKVVKITQESGGPWSGGTALTLESNSDLKDIKLCLRIPPGSVGFEVAKEAGLEIQEMNDNYVKIAGLSSKKAVLVSFRFKARKIHPHPLNLDNAHCISIARGPFIYCAETTDNMHIDDLRAIRIPDDARFTEEVVGKEVLSKKGFDEKSGLTQVVFLKTHVHLSTQKDKINVPLTLIPYFMWANRGASDLRVWMSRV